MRWLILACLLTSTAHARHTADTPATDYSAYTLKPWEWRLGPFRNAVGVYDGVSIGTLPLLLLFEQLRIANFQVKWRFWARGPWAAAARIGVFRYAPAQTNADGTEPFVANAFPTELFTTYRTERSTYNLGVSFTPVNARGSAEAGGIDGAIETAMLQGAWEWRWTETTAFVFEGRLKLSERLVGGGSTIQTIDEDSYLEIHAGAGAALDQPKGNVSASVFWSWDSFNLRLGLVYGHPIIPVANVFFPDELLEEDEKLGAVAYPELDLFWRF